MSDMVCDDCGEQPYLAQLTGDYNFDSEPDVEIWCECPIDRPIVFDGSSTFDSEKPEKWGPSGGRFVCYECGEIPVMRSHVTWGGTHPRTRYYLLCACEHTQVGFNWRDIHPDRWKKDMDPTKWESHHDEIKDVLEEHGPLTREQIEEHVSLEQAGVKCQVIHMSREKKLHSKRDDDGRKYLTPRMLMDSEAGRVGDEFEDNENEYSEPDETGLRSGKGPAWFSKLLGWF